VAVAGHGTDEVVLLLAELMDNATIHSRGQVVVQARRLVDRVVIQIIDDGIGMDEHRRRALNERLSAPVVDVASVSRMGLTVVGLLAAHHGLHVELRTNLPRGTIAEVVLPGPLLRRAGAGTLPLDGRHRARPQAITTSAVARPRRPIASPAALAESTQVLPVFATPRTPNGLPVRKPQEHAVPERRGPDMAWRVHRDPHQVAAGIAAYARGVHRAQAQHRPPWTDDQGA
jgi:hypothetical protein